MKVLIVKQKNTFGIATKNSLQHVHGCSPSLQSQNCHKRQLREKKLMRPSSIWDRSAPSLTGPQRGRTEETPTPPKKHPRWPCRASDGFWLFTHRQLWKMKQWKTITRAQRKSRHPAPIAYPLVRRQFTSSLIDRQWRPNRQGTCLTETINKAGPVRSSILCWRHAKIESLTGMTWRSMPQWEFRRSRLTRARIERSIRLCFK